MTRLWDRRKFLSASAAALSTMAKPARGQSGANEVVKKTFIDRTHPAPAAEPEDSILPDPLRSGRPKPSS
jgi:hypothetical protein